MFIEINGEWINILKIIRFSINKKNLVIEQEGGLTTMIENGEFYLKKLVRFISLKGLGG
jgi:hypothetical protein